MDQLNLTTGDVDPQVNSEEQDTLNTNEDVVDESSDDSVNVDDSLSNEPDTSAYDEAWDKVDINDDSIFNEPTNTNDGVTSDSAGFDNDPLSTTQETNNNIGAFMVDKPVLKYKGRDIPIDNEAELLSLAQKGFSYETEMANMKPKKKALSIIEGVPLEILQAVADIHSGNTSAISYIKSQYGIEDTRSTDESDNFWDDGNKPDSDSKETPAYTPEVSVDNPIEEFWTSYSAQNQQAAAKVSEIYGGLDESFKSEIYQPNVFPAFVQSVESGEFDKAFPMAIKEKSLNPAMTWLQAYAVGVQKIGAPAPVNNEPPASATPPSNTGGQRNLSGGDADRVWNDDAYFKELEAKLFG